jgi:hypothetical protein
MGEAKVRAFKFAAVDGSGRADNDIGIVAAPHACEDAVHAGELRDGCRG